MDYLLFYDVASDYLERRGVFRAEHLALAWEAQSKGHLILAGALSKPADGAVFHFKGDSPAAAEQFATNDPYVRNGLVTRWRVREWTTVVGDAASTPVRAAPASTADREFVHSRLIDARPAEVFRAFIEPERLARWWGPNGFTSTFEIFEPWAGGRWRFVMHGPDGTDYANESVFREVVAPERVVFEHLSEGHHFWMTITFTAQGYKTLVGWRQVFDTAAHKERIAAFVSDANEQNLSRLDTEVQQDRPSRQ
jgi:uncharacterized protein YndB with AHSA1/START domain/uncharacterized protein YciI